jgi:hypothetical protein
VKKVLLFCVLAVALIGAGAMFVYTRSNPQYCLLLFGPEARVRVWVILDGKVVSIDRHGDDFPRKGERVGRLADCKGIELLDPDRETRYIITRISDYEEGHPPQRRLIVNVDVKGPLEYRQYGDVGMAEQPQGAAIAHFHGPLTVGPRTILWKLPPKLALIRGEKPTDLPANVGTMDAVRGCWVVVRTHNGESSAFPDGVFPVVDVEFASQRPGDPPVKRRYPLDKFC